MFGKKRNIKKKKTFKKSKIELNDMPSSNMKREYYKKRRAQNRIKNTIFKTRSLIKWLLIICMLCCISKIAVCHYWYLPQNAFQTYPNMHLKIIGNRITPDEKILKTIRTIPIEKKPLYLINTSSYEKEIEKLSPVKKAFVRRYWLPTRFEVTIDEEIPLLTISPNHDAPEIAAITKDGRVISKDYLPLPNKANKTYKILTYDDYTKWSKDEIIFLKTLSQRIEDFSDEKLLYLDIRNKKDVYAQLETIKVRIGEFNSTLKDRIERLSSIMPQIENLKNQTDYIDIRWDNTTYLKKKSKKTILPPFVTKDTNQKNVIKPSDSKSSNQPKPVKKDINTQVKINSNQNLQQQKPVSAEQTSLPLKVKTVEP